MEEEKIVVGLDIGTTKIVAIAGRKNEFGKLEILGMGKAVSEGVTRGVVSNIDRTVEAIQKAILEAEEQAGINISQVNVGIAGQHIRSIQNTNSILRESPDDEITDNDIRRLGNDMHRMVIPPGDEIIHVMPQCYKVDEEHEIKNPVGMAGTRLSADFHVITAQIAAIKNIKKCVQKSNLEIVELVLEPLASSLSVLEEDEKEAGVVLVDIGGGTTDVAVFYEGVIRHTAVIPLGGNIITQDVKEGCKVMYNQAEQLKVKFGRAIASEANSNEIISIPGLRNRPDKEISVKNLAHIIEARMTEIIEFVHYEIAQSTYENRLTGGIVITGGGSQLQNCKQLFEYVTGMDVRIGYPNEHLGKGRVEEVKSPTYATAVGLVLVGFHSYEFANVSNREKREILATQKATEKNDNSTSQKKGLNDFFVRILEKTKGLLMDDFDDKQGY
ncbi:MAG TPA: cell division protein FtsA [Cytophagales bacterium]|nr:cell division protein FtsA [Cytophagales bacterium]